MKEYLEKLPKDLQEILHLIGKLAAEMDMPAYLVGGFVRDLILGVDNFDLDIVIEGDGIAFAEKLGEKFNAKITRHRRFGTATLALAHKLKIDGSPLLTIDLESIRKIDIATARKEIYPHPASLPEVTPGCLEDDAFRRDFTINAMAISISGKNYGKLVDIFNGKADLAHKKIRVLHDLSFVDDPTRILRAIRFEQRFNFRIEPHTLKLLQKSCREKALNSVEPQRLRDELVLVLKEYDPVRQVNRVRKLSGFTFMHPRLTLSDKQLELLKGISREISWFERQYAHRRQLESWLVYLIGMLDVLKLAQVRDFCRRFAFPSGVKKRILSFKDLSPRIIKNLCGKNIKPSQIFQALEPLSYEVLIALKAKYRNICLQKNIQVFFKEFNGLRPHTKGEDLRKLGIEPGPHYKKIFDSLLKARLNGKVKTKEEEIALITKLTKKGS
ncbi:MAG: hypothetical protein PHT31_02780 [Candidatus Omnitrophica bacterium]|nr:hypothetical protein [Candidatus Omnitrophota bacterium]MDD5653073.1 hypothetical protein [Candidatus Omnitrophota bacterium]